MAKRIDYSKSANEILWECLRSSALYILGKKKLTLSKQEREDLALDICIRAHERVMNHLHNWNKDFEFAKFVYWHVWSVSGGMVDTFIKNNIWEYNNIESLDEKVKEDCSVSYVDLVPSNSKMLYKSRHEYDKLKRKSYKRKSYEDNEEYDDYVDYCLEFGIEPMSKESYLEQSF